MGSPPKYPSPSKITALRYFIFEALKALAGGDDAKVKEALIRMNDESVDYYLHLAQRFEGLCKEQLQKRKL